MRNLLGFSRRVTLAVILAASLTLRLWGSGFGLPAYTHYHPDEPAVVTRAAQILWTGDWNLHRFNYPPFYAYVQASAYAAYFLWGAAHNRWEVVPSYVVPEYYHMGRVVTAIAGTLTAMVVYLIGRELYGTQVGMLGAALLGGCYLHIIHSHYATFDVMVGLLASLTLLSSVLLVQTLQTRWYFLAGICAGLAGATKYNGAVVLVVPLLAHVVAVRWGRWGWLSAKLFVCLGGFLLGFFGGNPFALSSLPHFLNGLAMVLYHYGTQQPGFEGRGNWRWYVSVFLTSADALWFTTALLGMVHLSWRDRRRGILLGAFPLVYFLIISQFVVRFERNMVPILPFLAIGGAWLLHKVAQSVHQLLKGRPGLTPVVSVVSLLLVLVAPLVATTAFDAAISQTDLREVAGRWLEENVPGGKIAIESYSIPFDHTRYEVQDVVRITDHDLSWYQSEGFDVFVVSDGVWDILRSQPEIYASKLAAYDELTTGSQLLAEFVPDPPNLVVAGYPTVAVYHFAPVRIYKVPR